MRIAERPWRGWALGSGRGLDRHDLEGVHLPVFVADRDVFAGPEGMGAEAIAGFVVLLGNVLVIEHPAGVAGTPRAVHQTPHLVRLALPEATHAAMVAVLSPELHIDMPAGIERGHELVTMAGGARGKFLRAGQVEPDALEHMRQRRHVPTSRLAGSRRRTPADAGSLLQRERGTSTLRKVPRIADRSYFGHGPGDKAGRSGHADATRAKARFSEPPRHPALAHSDAIAAGNLAPARQRCSAA